ncbi:MAG: flavodoxin family protein [Proteobacteria bacterium]|nr:flavodoxin family protein [Pseudomonadota bacterium]
MSKKIVCLFGSPRPKGNSNVIARRFNETAEKLGAKVKSFSLNKLQYRGCQACMTCKTKLDKCVLKDDLAEVLDEVQNCDILVIATPIYYGEVSSQVKAFIDRTFSYFVPDFGSNPYRSRLKPGKKMVFIQTQGHPEEKRFEDVFERYAFFFDWHGFGDNQVIRACEVMNVGDAEVREDLMKLAEETAKKVV